MGPELKTRVQREVTRYLERLPESYRAPVQTLQLLAVLTDVEGQVQAGDDMVVSVRVATVLTQEQRGGVRHQSLGSTVQG